MKILAIIGSPRRGNTFELVSFIEEKMKESGQVEFDYLFLKDADLKLCLGCIACIANGFESCPIDDDLKSIRERMKESDGIILAAPVYVMSLPALMKNLIDRLAFICHRPEFFDKHCLVVSTTGALGLKKVLNYLGSVAGIWGFRTIRKIGVVTPPGNEKSGKYSRKDTGKIIKISSGFYRELSGKVLKAPSLGSVIQFRIQRSIFVREKGAKIMPADYMHYRNLLDRNYFVEAKINFFKNFIAYFTEKLAKLFFR